MRPETPPIVSRLSADTGPAVQDPQNVARPGGLVEGCTVAFSGIAA